MKHIFRFFISIFLVSLMHHLVIKVSPFTVAQTWSRCQDGTAISRCETYDCPQGDTNKDGNCTLSDQGAKFTDARTDSYCANPASNCGQILYFKSQQSTSCAVLVKENSNNCDLYQAGSLERSTATPSAIPTPTPSSTAQPSSTPIATKSPSPTPTQTPQKSIRPTVTPKPTLPATGPSFFGIVALATSGFGGLFLYEKYKIYR